MPRKTTKPKADGVSAARRTEALLRKFALAYPSAHEDFPWGERVVKVKGKVFVFMHRSDSDLHVTVKLPTSGLIALSLPFAKPTGYGLGKSGWVSASFGARQAPPVEMLQQWIDESYRAVAPKKLIAALQARARTVSGSRRSSSAR
ncbi:MAG TPA: MmcQ/YjbR family DNA-binding protein [Vicinamibacteria bacterium]|jgi:predicted DNA-binding protein (MmcQ/YjbR family)